MPVENTTGRPSSPRVRVDTATPADRVPILSIFDAAMLETDSDALAARIEAGTVLVARTTDGERRLGALAREGTEIVAIAVRPRRRGQGIGTLLVETALARCDRVTATFDRGVRPFWESVGFTVSPIGETGRFRGYHPA